MGVGQRHTIVGVDETGRGSLFGPVITCAVAFPAEGLDSSLLSQLGDSKALSPKRREAAAAALHGVVRYAFGAASAAEIDRINILQATMLAMRRAVLRLDLKGMDSPQVIVDGNRLPLLPYPGRAVIKADATVEQVMAASILAKVFRDRFIQDMAARYPGFLLERNKGYGSAGHFDAITRLGPSCHHRRSFIGRVTAAAA